MILKVHEIKKKAYVFQQERVAVILNYGVPYILYLISALFCLQGNIELGNIFLICGLVLHIVICIVLLVFKLKITNYDNYRQFILIHCFFALFLLGGLISKETDKSNICIICLEVVCVFLVILYETKCLFYYKRYYQKKWRFKLNKYNKYFLLICFIFLAMSISCLKVSYMWDSEIYTRNIVYNALQFDFTFKDISYIIRSHVNLGFDFIYRTVFYILGGNGNFLIVGNFVLGLVTIYAYGEIIRYFISDISPTNYFLSTLLLAVAPLFLGIISTITLDFFMFCVFILFVYAHIKRRKIYQIIMLFLLCFSKEPGVILGGAYVGSFCFIELSKIVISECRGKKVKIERLIKRIPIKQYILYSIPFVAFCLMFLLRGNYLWISANDDENYIMNQFGFIGFDYIVSKFKEIFMLNYSWFFWCIIVLFILLGDIKKIKINKMEYMVSIGISFMAYMLFNFIYITYLHPRYIIGTIFITYLFFVVTVMNMIRRDRYRKVILILANILLVSQSFYNSDMISKKIYDAVPIQNGQLLSTREFDKYLYSDANIYNRQYIYWQYALLEFMDEIDYNGKDLLIFPDIEYQLRDGMSRYSILGLWKEESDLFYDPFLKSIDNYKTDRNIVINTAFYNELSNIEEVKSRYERIYYVDIGILANKDKTTSHFLSSNEVIEKKEYKKRSWKIIVYTLEGDCI